ncbi:MAG: hypothetical protein M3124_09670 [Actinomycetota bacterium]|nr:hypothetical protein [Actinomycetota bacterium]
MTEAVTQTMDALGATLTSDIRQNEASSEPILLLIASPMGAAGFTTLSKHDTDRTVVTYDPCGSERSVRTDGAAQSTPDVGKTPATFRRNHGGFLGGEYGQTGDPDALAAELRDLLTELR